ncbi:prophage P2a protein 25 [Lactiplantibacillus plantarum]|nr:prophage P2a protein 25 [Lactiplantibacillus plantarum]MCG0619371.1 prophage P2a protein 25 [Lactiplantibacillus plantarum]MCG0780121.1 prophage P2a protein 25 [Lactiplantibacillus plantarum]MCG0807818.1 prophage P2a protein 25 [Lactiplantibacillus plantarum]MCG0832763.1 prophage P2a protein 25 [Lactiplantibacillus plantarum]
MATFLSFIIMTLRRTRMPKHTKKRSTIKRKHRRMKQHAEENKAKALDGKQLAKEYGPYRIGKAGK